MNKENLDAFDKAYESSFKYNNENELFLSKYGNYVSNSIRKNNLRKLISLGIGHQIVSDILLKELNNNVDLYHIVEGSKSIINKFRDRVGERKGLSLIHSYFENYSPETQFDAIEMGFVLEHVDDPLEILKKFKDFLTSNGKIFIGVPNAASLHRQIAFHAGLIDSIYNLSEYDISLGHKRYFDLDQIMNLTKKAGYEIENVSGLFLKPITTDQMLKLGWSQKIFSALIKLGENNPEISNCVLIEACKK